MLPDTGERYLSTPLFADIPADMTAEEIGDRALDAELPFRRAGRRRAPPQPVPPQRRRRSRPTPPRSSSASIDDREQPVVMFALEWCEFCWSVRRMFAKLGIPYRSVDLDSVEYQQDDRGGKIRAALAARTSFTTIPQIFVGGEFLGGCTDVFDAYKQGRLQELLEKNQRGLRPQT